MTAPWNGPPDDHDPLDRLLRDLHDHLRERFAPDVHDADRLTAFLTRVDELARAAPPGMRSLPVPPAPPPGRSTIDAARIIAKPPSTR
ncbi:MAG TPA: hypothetical protein VFV67_12265 [Actinophytocola sp.]|uniref:hypothetical protein n=1 Tax=Actinophytocola sp. TaxID=1872138 RepID=UPI002DB84346|nr:hypothetical protein [Actinophytocola sp.]HEU5471420.1 hypothetical protein [Actinophytocola sp.]